MLDRFDRLDRRSFMGAGLSLVATTGSAYSAGTLSEDGLYHQDWFIESFLDLGEDLASAAAKGKRFAILWGLKGCPACKTMHEVHFEDTTLVDYIRPRFDILHLNILGAKEVTDFDGRKRGEKAFSQHYGIRGTPSIQFFPRTRDAIPAGTLPERREVARMPGLLEPKAFLSLFRYVQEEGYLSLSFVEWRAKNGA